jgi:hypothetical protein
MHCVCAHDSVCVCLQKKGPGASGQQLLSNPMQLRMAMREMCHQWAAAVQEQAVKIHVLQR